MSAIYDPTLPKDDDLIPEHPRQTRDQEEAIRKGLGWDVERTNYIVLPSKPASPPPSGQIFIYSRKNAAGEDAFFLAMSDGSEIELSARASVSGHTAYFDKQGFFVEKLGNVMEISGRVQTISQGTFHTKVFVTFPEHFKKLSAVLVTAQTPNFSATKDSPSWYQDLNIPQEQGVTLSANSYNRGETFLLNFLAKGEI